MIPKEQKIEFYYDSERSDNTLNKECQKWIDRNWVIHQIIPVLSSRSCYLLLYKY